MKTIKETKKLIAYFLICTLLMPSVTSCIKDTDEVDNRQDFSELTDGINRINSARPDIEEILRNNQVANRNNEYGITQELVDDFAVEYGFEGGAITMDFVEAVIEQQAIIELEGFEHYTFNLEYNPYTKEKLVRMSAGELIEDLENDLDFQDIPLDEKNILMITKQFQDEIANFNTSNRMPGWQPEWDTESFIGGMFVYQIAIGFASAPIGAFIVAGLVGVLVHNIVSWITK